MKPEFIIAGKAVRREDFNKEFPYRLSAFPAEHFLK